MQVRDCTPCAEPGKPRPVDPTPSVSEHPRGGGAGANAEGTEQVPPEEVALGRGAEVIEVHVGCIGRGNAGKTACFVP